MGRVAVRQAVQGYLQNAGIQKLGKVFPHPPKWTNETDFTENGYPGQGSGFVIYLHLRNQSEFRAALGGATSGTKFRPHKLNMLCLQSSKKPHTEDVDADNDVFLDSLVATIEANRNAGNPSAVFQWGEGDTLYAPDIHITVHMPRSTRQQATRQFSLIEVTVLEQLST